MFALYNLTGLFRLSHYYDNILTIGSFVPLNVMCYYHVNVFAGMGATLNYTGSYIMQLVHFSVTKV